MQTELSFDAHKRENNSESQKNLDANRERFSAKCGEVYRRLMLGERLTVRQCAIDGISSLPRRIKDLRDQGVRISDEWVAGVKVYFCMADDLAFNRWTWDQVAA